MDEHEARRAGESLGHYRRRRRAEGAERERERQERRAFRYEARHSLRGLTGLARLRVCGWTTIQEGGPVLRITHDVDGDRAGWAGVSTCGSVWACPTCSEKVQAHRREELVALVAAAIVRGGSVVLVTLTVRHSAGDRMAEVWDDLGAAWAAVNRDGSYRRHREEFGYVGWVRAVEATFGDNGPHLHIHALVVLDQAVTPERALMLGELMWRAWHAHLSGRPGREPVRAGFDVRIGQGAQDRMGQYLAKQVLERADPVPDGLAAEMTMSNHKRARAGRSPFQVLRDIVTSGVEVDGERVIAADERDVRLWLEWERASHGRKQLTWSKGLREWADLGEERSDEDVAAEEVGGDEVIALSVESWRAVRRHPWLLLDLAEQGGRDAVVRYLDSRGLEWFDARPAPRLSDPRRV